MTFSLMKTNSRKKLLEIDRTSFGVKAVEKAHERTGLPVVAFLAFVASAK